MLAPGRGEQESPDPELETLPTYRDDSFWTWLRSVGLSSAAGLALAIEQGIRVLTTTCL